MSIFLHDLADEFRLEVRGELDEREARELEQCYATARSSLRSKTAVVDLRRMTSMDDTAGATISELRSQGVRIEQTGASRPACAVRSLLGMFAGCRGQA